MSTTMIPNKEKWIKKEMQPSDSKRTCLTCDKKLSTDKKTKSLIGGVELMAYATYLSRHDFHYREFSDKRIVFCMCDDCFETQYNKSVKYHDLMSQEIE
jgi:hypothetical protein